MSAAPLRILFLGTPEFAVPSLRALAESRHHVVGVVSQPDRPRGRGRKLAPTPVKLLAQELSIPVLQPEKVGDPEAVEWMRERAPDVAVVVAFGQFIPKRVRELPRLEIINGHASLLPRWRGAAPVQWAIAAGDARTGVCVMRVVKQMDAGEVCEVREIEIGPEETAGELSERLSELAAPALVEAVERLAAGTAVFTPQPAEGVTEAPKVDREFARLEWGWPAERVLCRIRAATPRPGSDVRLRGAGKTFRILRARLATGPDLPAPRPWAVRVSGPALLLGALDGWIEVLRIQVQGRRPVGAPEFLRGAGLSPDEEIERDSREERTR